MTGWGFNSRLDNLQAAILDYRLRKYDAMIARRRELARAYHAALEGRSGGGASARAGCG